MKKFEYEGKWYQELDPKDYRIFDSIECIAKDRQDEKWCGMVLTACVKRSNFSFITLTHSFDQCAIPCDPPESRLMTNRELAELLCKWFGESIYGLNIYENAEIYAHHLYNEAGENNTVEETVRIRSWDSTEWIKPTIDIYNKFLNKDHK